MLPFKLIDIVPLFLFSPPPGLPHPRVNPITATKAIIPTIHWIVTTLWVAAILFITRSLP
jgi:hypothetical protein